MLMCSVPPFGRRLYGTKLILQCVFNCLSGRLYFHESGSVDMGEGTSYLGL